ncbi:metallophosphoesterase [Nodosilinea sp. P-1105]|uniref:metallophosphoesterase family protein n=1 Tax=Nodosilinea sp. P-1105 TaxID=2546229 RepID=UPI00146D6DAF|nr:metallophosphoesterase [Nodosilinea sp. P-1105]NMF84085.1 metallophosphoesterase [Nodosilinea sp. P-1105]
MGSKRFLTGIGLGLILSLCLACTHQVLMAGSMAAPGEVAVSQPVAGQSDQQQAEDAVAELPAATQAILAAAAPHGVVNPPRKDVRLAIISDLNSAYGSTHYEPEVSKGLNLLPYWQPDLVICGGDMVAGQKNSLTADQIRAMWAAFDREVAAPLRQQQLPFGFTMGNHDGSAARGANGQFTFQLDRDLATAYWTDPNHDPGLTFIDRYDFPFYYTFEYGDIFFMVWDGSSHRIPEDKLAWVERSLASDRAQTAKARMLISHLPLYGIAIGRDRPGEVMANPDQLRAMLERYNVHTYISGHQHAYYPGHRGNLQLLHTGILGAGPRALIAGDRAPWKGLTIVDIDFADPDLTTYTTYNIQTLETVDDEALPRSLRGHNGTVFRRDVAEPTGQGQPLCSRAAGNGVCTDAIRAIGPKIYAA